MGYVLLESLFNLWLEIRGRGGAGGPPAAPTAPPSLFIKTTDPHHLGVGGDRVMK